MGENFKNLKANISEELKKFDNVTVEVGYFDRKNSVKALTNDKGSITKGIPPRPFMSTLLSRRKREIQEAYKLGVKNNDIDFFGMVVVNLLKTNITTGNWTPNAPSTHKRKGRNQPLVDTDEMLRITTYKVKK